MVARRCAAWFGLGAVKIAIVRNGSASDVVA
jgi:hypothetical protein